ncbi:DUF397 domain-containing protein [Streptomyces sp. NPDC058442]|uniref:DUF397 domain-containing protein n=1 Tax=Streptomyces sp. NPDC058442 TaxID=3346503 RepID=UPI0036646BC3
MVEFPEPLAQRSPASPRRGLRRRLVPAFLGNNCVEVADGLPTVVPVRDSKTPHGPVLRFPITAWTAFLDTLKGPGSPTD